MASSTRTLRLKLSPTVKKTIVSGLAVFAAIVSADVYLKKAGLHSTWYLGLIRDHGADFAGVGFVTYSILLAGNVTLRKPSRRDLKDIVPTTWVTAGFFLFWAVMYECGQFLEKPSVGDWRDLVAYLLGSVCTIVPIVLADRRDRHQAARSSTRTPAGRNLRAHWLRSRKRGECRWALSRLQHKYYYVII